MNRQNPNTQEGIDQLRQQREQEGLEQVRRVNEETASRHEGNNTEDNQRTADKAIKGDKGHQHQGDNGSRQGEGGNSGGRGNVGLS